MQRTTPRVSHVGRCVPWLGLAAMALGLAASAPSVSAADGKADDLDHALLTNAPTIIQYLKDKKCQSVGVLKFLVQKGNEAPSDNIGPLNLSIANRLEVALVLADPDERLGVVRRASEQLVKANNRRANHLTRDGRRAFFDTPFAIAWGRKTVQPDVFLTGTVQISPDLKQTTVQVQAFSKDDLDLARVTQFAVATDARTLGETGESYALSRGIFQGGKVEVVSAVQAAKEVEQEKKVFPLLSKDAPIWMDILYDGAAMPIKAANGKGEVPEPKQGQKVTFTIQNKDKEKRYGVVLKVNGENTLYREKLDPAQCTKWILDPGETIQVKGFQMTDGSARQFEVLAPEDSEKEEVNYNEHSGTFTVAAFVEKSDKESKPITLEDLGKQLAAVKRGELPQVPPAKLSALQDQLKSDKNEKGDPKFTVGRGLVVEGGKIRSSVDTIKFETDPTPVVLCTMRYYPVKKVKKTAP